MPVPDYGAAPLAKTFVLVRALSVIAMIAIVGMTANFVAEIVGTNVDPPRDLVATLAIVSTPVPNVRSGRISDLSSQACLAALYCLVSIPFFYARANLGLFVMAGIDLALLVAFIIVSVVLGRSLNFLNCVVIGNHTSAANAQNAFILSQSLASNTGKSGGILALSDWARTTQTHCLQTKAIWGLSIALCILFTCSVLLLPTLRYKNKNATAPTKTVV
nr:hypothetical protein CFP56_66829 [Quercus suber]